MLQRFIKPVLFAVLLVCIAFLAVYSERGASILSSTYHLGTLADYAKDSPFAASLAALAASLPALLLFFVPQQDITVLLVSTLGFCSGTFFAALMTCLAGGAACFAARFFMHDTIRLWMANRRRLGLLVLPKAAVPIEYCLLASAILLVCGVPAVLAGCLLGILGMRPKAFLIASYPYLAGQAVMTAFSVVPAAWYSLLFFSILGLVIATAYGIWLFSLLRQRRLAEKAEAKEAHPARTKVIEEQQFADIDIDEEPEQNRRQGSPSGAVYLNDALLVLARERGDDRIAACILEEAAALGIRTESCRLGANAFNAAGAGSEAGSMQGLRTFPDLDDLFVHGFQSGSERVLAVRPVSALLRRDLLQEALHTLSRGCGLVLGRCGQTRYLVGVSGRIGSHRYEEGSLQGCGFDADIVQALAEYTQHPGMLPLLPPNAELNPLVSVIIAADKATPALAATVRAAAKSPCSECYVVTQEPESPLMGQAVSLGAEILPVKESLAASLNEAAAKAQGKYLLFIEEGVELPQSFDKDVWDAMRQEKCRAGGFAAPASIPCAERTVRWLGTAVRSAGPDLGQGVFLEKELFASLGGLEGEDVAAAVAQLVKKAGASGRIILHNARVRHLHPLQYAAPVRSEASASGRAGFLASIGADWLFAEGKKRLSAFFARPEATLAEQKRKEAVFALRTQIADFVAECDHCGRCTHVSPMLHKHNIDLADLASHPLLAWHCFLCGACTSVCHKGIDGVALVRMLRRLHVLVHGGRLARPGHGRTLFMARCCPVYAKCAREGRNLLLTPSFCASQPKTALELGRLCLKAGIGLIVADTGAELADLGLEDKAKEKAGKLKKAMARAGADTLLTISPAVHRFLASMGIASEPFLLHAAELGLGTLSMQDRCLFVSCADRCRKTFLQALAPLLRGEVREIDVPCCGAGGEAHVLEPAVSAKLKKAVQAAARKSTVVTGCPRCVQTMKEAGIAAELDISILLNVQEKTVTGIRQAAAYVSCLKQLSALFAKPEPEPQTEDEAMPEAAEAEENAFAAAEEEVQEPAAGMDDAGSADAGDASDSAEDGAKDSTGTAGSEAEEFWQGDIFDAFGSEQTVQEAGEGTQAEEAAAAADDELKPQDAPQAGQETEGQPAPQDSERKAVPLS